MKEVKFNGFSLSYDETLKVGDLITSSYKGIHRIRKITFDTKLASIGYVEFEKVLTDDYLPSRKVVNGCDISWCRRVDKAFIEELRLKFQESIARLEALM